MRCRATALVTCLCLSLCAGRAGAWVRAGRPIPPPHLEVYDEDRRVYGKTFDASLTGFRAYLLTIMTTNPTLYAQLAPEVERFETRDTIADGIMLSSLGVAVAGVVAAMAVGSQSCPPVPAADPNRAADLAVTNACIRHHDAQAFTVGGLSAGLAVGVLLLGGALKPSLSDLVDKHNRLAPWPVWIAIGYDQRQGLASAGAALTF